MTSNLLKQALEYAAKGYHIFPVKPGAKEPLTPNGHNSATTEKETIQKWWTRWPDANIGLALMPSSLLVIDIDRHPDKANGLDAFKQLAAKNKIPEKTPISGSGGHGFHIILKRPTGKIKSQMAPGIDIKANGYIILPPSIHPNGKPYKWGKGHSLLECQPSTCPKWLLQLVLSENKPLPDKEEKQYPSSKGETIIQRCAFMKHFAEDATYLSEPDWYLGIGILAYTEDASELIHKFSSLYPGYSRHQTEAKLKHWKEDGKGPPTCLTIQKKGDNTYCQGCRFNGHIKSPIILGYNSKPLVIVNTMTLPEQVNIILKALHIEQHKKPNIFIYGGKLVEVISDEVTAP